MEILFFGRIKMIKSSRFVLAENPPVRRILCACQIKAPTLSQPKTKSRISDQYFEKVTGNRKREEGLFLFVYVGHYAPVQLY